MRREIFALSALAIGGIFLGVTFAQAQSAPQTFGAMMDACIVQNEGQQSSGAITDGPYNRGMTHFTILRQCFWQLFLTERQTWLNTILTPPPGADDLSSSVSSGSGASSFSSVPSSSSSGASLSSASSGSGSVAANAISMENLTFYPSTLTVKVGTRVTWKNDEASMIPHTVTFDVPNAPMSGMMFPGDTFSVTFSGTGSFIYHCMIHPEMKGTVVVTP